MKKIMSAFMLIASLLMASPAFAYTVKSGDTMTQIARDHHMSLKELAQLNPQVTNLDLIFVGQTIQTAASEMNDLFEDEQYQTSKAVEMKTGYSEYEMDLLARLVRAEAQGEPLEGKIAVACVVLNRVDNPHFPDTIRGVIYQRGQFQPVSNGAINKPADEDSITAVQMALSGSRQTAGNSLFFYNPRTATSRWLDSRATTVVIGHHVFKK